MLQGDEIPNLLINVCLLAFKECFLILFFFTISFGNGVVSSTGIKLALKVLFHEAPIQRSHNYLHNASN